MLAAWSRKPSKAVHAEDHLHPRCARAQSEEHRRGAAARPADRHHRTVGLGQILARLRHRLCGRATPLCRVAVGLCAPVPGADAEARRRSHRRALARNLHRAEDDLAQSALDGRHGDRDLRLSAASVRARGRALFAGDGASNRKPDGEPDGRPHPGAPGRHAAFPARAHRARPQGRIQEGVRRAAEEGLPARQGRRQVPRDRRRTRARQEAQARHRSGRGSDRCKTGHRQPPARFHRDRARPHRRPRRRRIRRQEGRQGHTRTSFDVIQIRLPRLRLHHSGDRAAPVQLQQSAWRLSDLRRARHAALFRRGAGRTRRKPHAPQGRHRTLGQIDLALLPADAGGAGPTLQVLAQRSFRRPAEEGARRHPVRLGRRRDQVHIRRRAQALRDQEEFRGRDPQHAAPLQGNGFVLGARGAGALSGHEPLRGLRRLPPQAGSAGRQDRGPPHRRGLRKVDQARRCLVP